MDSPNPTPSPNHDARTGPVRFVVLHYTGMESGEAARARLCDAKSKVSAHYLVWEDGRVEALVPEHRRAWHAGVGAWQGETDMNGASIGVEIVNGGHDHLLDGELPPYPDAQVEAVAALVRGILARHDLSPGAVLGHSDLAPARKQDPGEHFPWRRLAREGVGVWPEVEGGSGDTTVLAGPDDGGREVAMAQMALARIGYAQEVSGRLDAPTRLALAAFQRRFRPARVDGLLDVDTLERLGALVGTA